MKSLQPRHSVQNVFLLLLMGLFVMLSMMLVLLSVQSYRGTVENTARSAEQRVASNYVYSVIRSEGASADVSVTREDGVDVLKVVARENAYVRRIYVLNGSLMENTQMTDDEFKAENGEIICDAASFVPELEDDGLCVTLRDAEGNETACWIALRGANAEN